MDQTFCLSACFKVHLMVVDLDRTDQLRQAGSIMVQTSNLVDTELLRLLENSDILLVTSHVLRHT